MFRIFHPCNLVPHFHVSHFHFSHFQRPHCRSNWRRPTTVRSKPVHTERVNATTFGHYAHYLTCVSTRRRSRKSWKFFNITSKRSQTVYVQCCLLKLFMWFPVDNLLLDVALFSTIIAYSIRMNKRFQMNKMSGQNIIIIATKINNIVFWSTSESILIEQNTDRQTAVQLSCWKLDDRLCSLNNLQRESD